jgi:hypothetical protein
MTENQRIILDMLQKGKSLNFISKKLRMSSRTVAKERDALGVLGEPYKKKKYKSIEQEVTDEYLLQDINVNIAYRTELNEEQMKIYKKYKKLKRTKLAALLGIDKLALNFILEKMRGGRCV